MTTNVLFATSFRNEQGTAAPARVIITSTASSATYLTNDLGFRATVTATSSQGWVMQANASSAKTNLCYCIRATALKASSDPTGTAWTKHYFVFYGARFGIDQYVVTDGQVLNISAARYQLNGVDTIDVYVNGVYWQTAGFVNFVGFVNPTTTGYSVSAQFTNFLIADDDAKFVIAPSFIDQTLTVTQNNWTFTGTDLVQSMNKTDAVTNTPYAQAYQDDWTFTVTVPSANRPLLVETASSTSGDPATYALTMNDVAGSALGTLQGPDQRVIPSTSQIVVGRKNIAASIPWSSPNRIACTMLDTSFTNLANNVKLGVNGTTPIITNSIGGRNDPCSLLVGGSVYLSDMAPLQNQDYTVEAWIYYPSSLTNSMVISANTSSTVYNASNLRFELSVKVAGVTNGSFGLSVYDDASGSVVINSNLCTLNAWHHMCMQRASNVAYVYCDGQLIGNPNQTLANTAIGMYIGNYYTAIPTGGYMSYYGYNVGTARYPVSGFTPQYPSFRAS